LGWALTLTLTLILTLTLTLTRFLTRRTSSPVVAVGFAAGGVHIVALEPAGALRPRPPSHPPVLLSLAERDSAACHVMF